MSYELPLQNAASCPLFRIPDPASFTTVINSLRQRYLLWSSVCPAPLPTTGLVITPEIRCQSEMYLPLAEIVPAFRRFYVQSLSYPPNYSSSPFYGALSWADLYLGLPCWLQKGPGPAGLLELLLSDSSLRACFLFYSFLPKRYNGAGFGRYPGQAAWLFHLLSAWRRSGKRSLWSLDAACGSGEGTWESAEILKKSGWQPDQVRIEGWTIEPLEVYAAAEQVLPHDLQRQQSYRQRVGHLQELGWGEPVCFKAVDLLDCNSSPGVYDLILCNGLLGGPILNEPDAVAGVVKTLAEMLSPGGCLVAASKFHDGWKKKTPEQLLKGLFELSGLHTEQAGEGIAGIRI